MKTDKTNWKLWDKNSWNYQTVNWLRKHRPVIKTVLRHCSASGMTRRIDVYAVKDGEMLYLSGICEALGIHKRSKNKQGLVVGGCGMDMGFAVVYALGRIIFPDGFKLRKGEYGRNGDKTGYDTDGGYALKQEWL
jgi:hypothetical protein